MPSSPEPGDPPAAHPPHACLMELQPWMVAVGVLIVAFVAGVILIALGQTFVGIIVACVGIPGALVGWITAGDRF